MRQPEIELCAYGKLPLHKEFLRVRCFGGSASYLRLWIDAGYAAAVQANGGQPYLLGTPLNLVVLPEKDKFVTVGRLRDSSDSGHERKFPFAAYTVVPLKALDKQASQRVAQLRPVLDELRRFEGSAQKLADVTAFQEAAQAARLPLPLDAPESRLRHTTVKSLAERTVGLERFPRVIWRIRGAALALAASKLPPARLPALRFPLAPEMDSIEQALLWLKWLETNDFPKHFKVPLSCAFADTSRVPGNLWVIPRPPRPEDFHLLGSHPESHLAPASDAADSSSPLGYTAFKSRVEDMIENGARLSDLALLRF